MPWYVWAVLAAFAVNAIVSILTIGEPRNPRTASEAVIGMILNGLIVWVIVDIALRCS